MTDKDLKTSLDGFLDNRFKAIQPLNGAHRSGLDAILLAAVLPADAKGGVADFGAGCGIAGMAVAQRCPSVTVDLIEIDHTHAMMAAESLGLPENRHLNDRLNVIEADLRAKGDERGELGLVENSYDHIIANPPYNTNARQTSANLDRARAHAMDEGMLEAWLTTAAALSRPKATLALIMRPETLSETLIALGGRFGSVRILPLQPEQNTPANRVIILAKQGGRAPLQILPAFTIHEQDGSFTQRAEAIFRGREGILL